MKEILKKYFNREVLLKYVYGEFANRFLGFIVGMWAVSLVGYFFEFPSFKNLWGLNSHKPLISKETFESLQWIAQVIIGFIVFEIVHNTLFAKVGEQAPKYYQKGLSYLEQKGYTEKARKFKTATLNQVKEKTALAKGKAIELLNRKSKNDTA